MPHVIVKMLPGRSEAQKQALAAAVTQALMATVDCAESSVSVSIQDVASERWTAEVWDPDIAGRAATLYKKPGYGRED